MDFNLRAGHAVMSEEKPEAKDRLGEDIKNSIRDDLNINTDHAATISDTPDTKLVISTNISRVVEIKAHIG